MFVDGGGGGSLDSPSSFDYLFLHFSSCHTNQISLKYPSEKRTISLYDTGRVQFYTNLVSEPFLVSWGSMAMWLRIKRTKRGGSLG